MPIFYISFNLKTYQRANKTKELMLLNSTMKKFLAEKSNTMNYTDPRKNIDYQKF